MKHGAYDYVLSPSGLRKVVHTVQRGLDRQRLQHENLRLKDALHLQMSEDRDPRSRRGGCLRRRFRVAGVGGRVRVCTVCTTFSNPEGLEDIVVGPCFIRFDGGFDRAEGRFMMTVSTGIAQLGDLLVSSRPFMLGIFRSEMTRFCSCALQLSKACTPVLPRCGPRSPQARESPTSISRITRSSSTTRMRGLSG